MVPQATGRHLTGPPAPEAEEWAPMQGTDMKSLRRGAPTPLFPAVAGTAGCSESKPTPASL